MSCFHQVRSTTASLLLGIAALVVVLPSGALWGPPSAALFDLGHRTTASSETLTVRTAPAPDPAGQEASATSRIRADLATVLRTEPWQSPTPLLAVLALVGVLAVALGVRLPGRWCDRSDRPVDALVHAAGGLRGPPSAL